MGERDGEGLMREGEEKEKVEDREEEENTVGGAVEEHGLRESGSYLFSDCGVNFGVLFLSLIK